MLILLGALLVALHTSPSLADGSQKVRPPYQRILVPSKTPPYFFVRDYLLKIELSSGIYLFSKHSPDEILMTVDGTSLEEIMTKLCEDLREEDSAIFYQKLLASFLSGYTQETFASLSKRQRRLLVRVNGAYMSETVRDFKEVGEQKDALSANIIQTTLLQFYFNHSGKIIVENDGVYSVEHKDCKYFNEQSPGGRSIRKVAEKLLTRYLWENDPDLIKASTDALGKMSTNIFDRIDKQMRTAPLSPEHAYRFSKVFIYSLQEAAKNDESFLRGVINFAHQGVKASLELLKPPPQNKKSRKETME